MSHFDYATYSIGGITLISDGYDADRDITFYRSRDFINPKDGKSMYLRLGRYSNHDWGSCELSYSGADSPIRYTENVYDSSDVLAFIADVERDEVGGASIRELLE
jgi:hypothetical protein